MRPYNVVRDGGRMVGLGPDEVLLLKIAEGDRLAFRKFYASTSGALLGVCLNMLRDRSRAEDVLQEAYVRIWERASLFDPAKGAALVWAGTLTRRLALNELRRTRIASVPIDGDDGPAHEIAADFVDPDPIGGRRLGPCLERLPSDQRTAVVLATVHGLTHSELAARLDKPLGTVKSWIARGLANLKECIG